MRILIAEDHPSHRLALRYLLTDWGYRSDFAPNGQVAVNRALAHDYDLALLNIRMPVLDGLQAARIIRARSAHYLPLIALTAFVWDRTRCLAAGMDDFLAKPYDIHDLHRKIQSLTVKSCVIEQCGNSLRFGKEKPMNAERLRELRALDERGLTKLIILSAGAELVVHKHVQNKIAHDFRIEKKDFSDFIDRSRDKPRLCRLYRRYLTVKCLLPEEMERLTREEDKLMEGFGKAALSRE